MNAKKLISAVFQLSAIIALAASAMGQAVAAPENPVTNNAQTNAPSAAPSTPKTGNNAGNNAGNGENNTQTSIGTVTRQQVIDELYEARKNGDIIRTEADYDVANFKTRHANK